MAITFLEYDTSAMLFESDALRTLWSVNGDNPFKNQANLVVSKSMSDNLSEVCQGHAHLSLISQKHLFKEDLFEILFDVREKIGKSHGDNTKYPTNASINDLGYFINDILIKFIGMKSFKKCFVEVENKIAEIELFQLKREIKSFYKSHYEEPPKYDHENHPKLFYEYFKSEYCNDRRLTYFIIFGNDVEYEDKDDLLIIEY
jgi:hypothetical protein